MSLLEEARAKKKAKSDGSFQQGQSVGLLAEARARKELNSHDTTPRAVEQNVIPNSTNNSGTDNAGSRVEQYQSTPQKRVGRAANAEALRQKRINEREQFLSTLSPERRALLESISPAEAALIGAGKGMTDIARGIGIMDKADQTEKEAFSQLEDLTGYATAGEIAGQAAPFILPGLGAASIASTPLRVAATSALGATEGGIISRGQGGDIGQQILSAGIGGTVAGALELGLPVIGRIGGKVFRRITGRTPKGSIIDEAGNMSDEFIQAIKKEGLEPKDILDEALIEMRGQIVDPEQAARKAFMQSQGIEPTKAQVTRLASDFMDQQELAKSTSRVRNALQRQNATLTSRFNNAILDTGGNANQPTSTIADAITERSTKLDSEISNLYKMARESAPEAKDIKFNKLTDTLRTLAPQNRRGGFNIESVVGELKERGILNDKMKVIGKVDVNTAEMIRQSVNDLFDPKNPFGNIQLRKIKDALDDDVFRASGDDFFLQARQAKAEFEKGLSRAKLSKFDSRKQNLVRDILENKVNPDSLVDDVIFSRKWRSEDISQLKKYLLTDDAGNTAFRDLKAETLQSIRDKAFSGAPDENGFSTITRDKLERALNKVGDQKLNIIFDPQEVKFLKDMLKITRLREPVSGTALGEGPTGAAINKLRQQIGKLGVVSDVIEKIEINQQGKIAIKAAPERIKQAYTGSLPRQAITLGGGAAAASTVNE